MARMIDITGETFGRATALHPEGKRRSFVAWRCRCSCGNEFVTTGEKLRKGHTKSCGCLAREMGVAVRTHGGSWRAKGKQTPEYVTWCQMRARCMRPTATHYADYGGRGITVCERWLKFENFIADMGGFRPAGNSLERIDHNGNYEPGNCKWLPREQQSANTRRTVWARLDGERMTQAEVARRLGRCHSTVVRWHRSGVAPRGVDLVFEKHAPVGPQEENPILRGMVAVLYAALCLQSGLPVRMRP